MNSNEIVIEHIVTDLNRGVFNDQVLHSLANIAASSEYSQQFVKTLIANQTSTKGRLEDAVSGAMEVLEKLAEHSESISCTFMKYLQPFADELQMHDVYDSIDLWLSR